MERNARGDLEDRTIEYYPGAAAMPDPAQKRDPGMRLCEGSRRIGIGGATKDQTAT
jgi:hypothetical protein